ncbi:Hypothetical predicted protein, partial [Paramuricea clavata]
MDGKREFIIAKRLCWGCLKWGHLNSNCRVRKICKVCSEAHPTSLHRDNRKSRSKLATKSKDDSSKSKDDSSKPRQELNKVKDSLNEDTTISNSIEVCKTNTYSGPISHSLIVPVWLHHKTNPNHKIMVYALLDEQSDTCFVKDSVLDEVGVDGPEVQLEISTVLARETVNSQKIAGLTVRGVNETSEITLPGTYAREVIPARHGQIPRPESARKWSHLEKIAEFFMPFRNDVVVGLLIGTNCARVIKPCEIIPGNDDDPYAKRTALGWGIVGIVEAKVNEESDENYVVVNRVITYKANVGPDRRICHLALRAQVKEIMNPSMFNQMFELDFSERRKEEPLSYEDKMFIKKVKKGIYQREDGHSEIPLPFKDDEMKLPNNKIQALSHLLKLKQRFLRDKKYQTDYLTFMNGIIASNYAELVPQEEMKLDNRDKNRCFYSCLAKSVGLTEGEVVGMIESFLIANQIMSFSDKDGKTEVKDLFEYLSDADFPKLGKRPATWLEAVQGLQNEMATHVVILSAATLFEQQIKIIDWEGRLEIVNSAAGNSMHLAYTGDHYMLLQTATNVHTVKPEKEKHRKAPQFTHDGPEEYNPGMSIFKGRLFQCEKKLASKEKVACNLDSATSSESDVQLGNESVEEVESCYPENNTSVNACVDSNRKELPELVVISSDDEMGQQVNKKYLPKKDKRKRMKADLLDELADSLSGLSSAENTPAKKVRVASLKVEDTELPCRNLFDE